MKKKLSLIAMLAAFVMVPGFVRGDEENTEKKADVHVKAQVTGKVITIGPNGEVKVQDFGKQADGAESGGKGARAAKVTIVAADEEPGKDEKNSQKKGEVRVFKFGGKAIKISSDGKLEKVQSLPEDIQELMNKGGLGDQKIHGTITVIGPDGKPHIQSIGDSELKVDSITMFVEKAVAGAGKDLPEGFHIKLREALKGLPARASVEIDDAFSTGEDVITKKLDEILKRLDKLEEEVRDLKQGDK